MTTNFQGGAERQNQRPSECQRFEVSQDRFLAFGGIAPIRLMEHLTK